MASTRAEFDDYWNTACDHVAMDDVVRAYLLDLINLRMINPLLALPFRPLLKFLTAGFLAPVFRDAVGVSWGRPPAPVRAAVSVRGVRQPVPARFIRQGGSYVLLADVRSVSAANAAGLIVSGIRELRVVC